MSSSLPVRVERQADGSYQLDWSAAFGAGGVRIRAHRDPERVAASDTLLQADGMQARVDAGPGPRHYFHLQNARGEALVAAQRDVPLDGGTNFRDLGGYRAADGRQVRWGRLFRSGHTAGLSEEDREQVAALGIAVCCDFRRVEEHSVEPKRLPDDTRVVSLPIDPGSVSSFFAQIGGGQAGSAEMARFMAMINREFVREHTVPYRRMFGEMLALESGGFMINCAAGKDRTGFASALILGALGVAEQDIVADYLLSARYFPIEREIDRVRRKYGPMMGGSFDTDMIRPMMETREEYIRAGLDTIRADFGGMEPYLEQALGVGPAERTRLRARFTT